VTADPSPDSALVHLHRAGRRPRRPWGTEAVGALSGCRLVAGNRVEPEAPVQGSIPVGFEERRVHCIGDAEFRSLTEGATNFEARNSAVDDCFRTKGATHARLPWRPARPRRSRPALRERRACCQSRDSRRRPETAAASARSGAPMVAEALAGLVSEGGARDSSRSGSVLRLAAPELPDVLFTFGGECGPVAVPAVAGPWSRSSTVTSESDRQIWSSLCTAP
jgi:hypothetical protein